MKRLAWLIIFLFYSLATSFFVWVMLKSFTLFTVVFLLATVVSFRWSHKIGQAL